MYESDGCLIPGWGQLLDLTGTIVREFVLVNTEDLLSLEQVKCLKITEPLLKHLRLLDGDVKLQWVLFAKPWNEQSWP